MTDLTIFNYEEKEVRTVMVDGEPWFVAKDVCVSLEITNISQALARLDLDEKNTIILNDGNRGNPSVHIVNEPGLYSLVLGSRSPKAKPFKRWVTHEVLPAIRKTGQYNMLDKITRKDLAKMLWESEEEKERVLLENERLQVKNKEMGPKAAFADDFQAAEGNILVRQLAKMLGGTGEKRLFEWLRNDKVLMVSNEPYQQYIGHGYFKIKSGVRTTIKGKKIAFHTLTVTPKGQYWIWKRWNEARGQLVLKIANQ